MSQLSAPNLTIEAGNGITYAYRRFGSVEGTARPLICFSHFRGNLDSWDPALVDPLADRREVVLFDNAGIGGSSGRVPHTITAMAHDALAFIEALGLAAVDVFGYCIGGYVAQELTLIRPQLVHRVVLAATAPQGGEQIHGFSPDVFDHAVHPQIDGEDLLALSFEGSEVGTAKGWEYVQRIFARTEGRDAPTTLAARDRQLDAITTWGIPNASLLDRLAGITQPVLVANGDNDRMVPTRNSHLLARSLPDARLTIYPDAGHGFLFQYAADFAAEVAAFLDSPR